MCICRAHGDSVHWIVESGNTGLTGEEVGRLRFGGVFARCHEPAGLYPLLTGRAGNTEERACLIHRQGIGFHIYSLYGQHRASRMQIKKASHIRNSPGKQLQLMSTKGVVKDV